MNDEKNPTEVPLTKSLFHPQRNKDAASSSEKRWPTLDQNAPSAKRLDFSEKDGGNREDGPDLDAMTIDALQSHRAEVDRKILGKRETDRRTIIDQIVTLVNAHHIPVEDLVEALGGLKRRLGPVAKKYRDPETGSTWSGRGKEPLWLRGKDRTKFHIP